MEDLLAEATMGIAVGIVAGFVAGLWLGREVANAPKATQDERGFHYLRRSSDLPQHAESRGPKVIPMHRHHYLHRGA
jgi:Na+/glutamate symporter